MRVLFVEGKEEAALRALAQVLPHPYWLLAGEGVFLLQVFGASEEALARARGQDPDRPRHLSKVTRTR